MDSPTHGEQENSVWNGHYRLYLHYQSAVRVSTQFGDLELLARYVPPATLHSADWLGRVCFSVSIVRYQGKVLRIYFRSRCSLRHAGSPRAPRS